MRFSSGFGWILSVLIGAAVLLQPGAAWSQLRTLPANAKRAIVNGYQTPYVVLGNETFQLAPGAVIYDTNNRSIVPLALPSQADVVFTTDTTGAVMRIYVLTPQEIQQLDQANR